jgi:hypothetical protein
MKKLAILAACLLTSLAAVAADGTVNFNNYVASGTIVNAPVLDATGAKLGGGYLVQLWAGPVGGALAAVGDAVPFRTQTAGLGTFAGGTRTIGGVTAGADAVIEVRAWRVAAGADYAAALASTDPNPAGNYGFSPQLTIKTGNVGEPPSLPADLVGLKGFNLIAVPEPSIIALGLVGAGALLLRRRK